MSSHDIQYSSYEVSNGLFYFIAKKIFTAYILVVWPKFCRNNVTVERRFKSTSGFAKLYELLNQGINALYVS